MRKFGGPPGSEILGQNIRAWTDNLQGENTAPIMKKYGLVDVDPHSWYPVEDLMNAMNDITADSDASSNLVAIGMEIGRIVPMPPEMPSPPLGDVLSVWDNVYQSLHRNGDVGKIQCEKVTETHYKLTFTDLYPDDFSYGIIYGYARRFLPTGTRFTVSYDTEITRRDEGGTGPTIIHVQW